MKRGDVVSFVGSWGPRSSGVNPNAGIVMDVWYNGRTKKLQSADVFWDNGEYKQSSVHVLRILNESR
mgnify:CR=1 FL=1